MTDSLELVAVCDTHPSSAQQAGEMYGAPAYTSIAQMVESERLDIADVAVPLELHHAVSCYLSQRGIAHSVETPIAPTLGLADLMIETAGRYGVKLQIAENFPFLPIEHIVQQIIGGGAIGKARRCYRLFVTNGAPGLFSSSVSHGVASIRRRLGGHPVAVSSCEHVMPVVAYKDSSGRPFSEEGLEFALIDFDNGALGVMMVGNKNGALGRNRLAGFETIGERGSVITNGNQGAQGGEMVYIASDEDVALRFGQARPYPIQREQVQMGDQKVTRRLWADLPGAAIEWRNPFAHLPLSESQVSIAILLQALADSVHDGAPLLWPGLVARTDVEVGEAMRRSIASNRQPVALPLPTSPVSEESFNRSFETWFGCHPYEIDKALTASFKAR